MVSSSLDQTLPPIGLRWGEGKGCGGGLVAPVPDHTGHDEGIGA